MNSSRFFSLIVGCVFVAVCAYIGAALYRQIDTVKVYAAPAAVQTVKLQGIVLRQELSITLSAGESFAAESGQRLAFGELLTLDSKGQGLAAPVSGVFFDSADGFEYLNVDDILVDDISALDSLLASKPEVQADGRLVTDNAWYFWAYCDATAALPISGSHKLLFDGFKEAVQAQIIAAATAEDGRQVLLLRLNQGGEYLSLRKLGAVVRE